MKIMHLMPSKVYSGAEHVACQICELFKDDDEYEMILVCTKGGSLVSVLKEKKINYIALDAFNYRTVSNVIHMIDPDIIHCHDFTASVLAKVKKGKQIISHLHNNPPWLSTINIKTISYALSAYKFKKIAGVSQAVFDEYIFKSVIKRKYINLPNVVDKERINRLSNAFEPCEKTDIVFVGRLAEQKNPILALQIIRRIAELREISCVFLGDGVLRPQCEQFIRENKMGKSVILKGFCDNPYPYMRKAKVLLLPSEYEGFGLVAVEAMLLGTPVVCSGKGGLSQIVHLSSGTICSSLEDYVRCITDILDSKDYEALSEKVKNEANPHSDISGYKKKLEELYRGSI